MYNFRCAMLVLGFLVTGTAFGHHSFANFDMTKVLTLHGSVHAWEWTNPHTWLWLDVPDGKGGVATWGLEGTAPGELTRQGWTRHSIEVGQEVSVRIHPLKSGKNGGSFSKVTFADGHSIGRDLAIAAGSPGTPAPPPAASPPRN